MKNGLLICIFFIWTGLIGRHDISCAPARDESGPATQSGKQNTQSTENASKNEFIAMDYSYLEKPFSYWLMIDSKGSVSYVEYKLSQGTIQTVKTGEISELRTNEIYDLLSENNFFELRANYDGGDEEMSYEGDFLILSAKSGKKYHRVSAVGALMPAELQAIVIELQQIPHLLQIDNRRTMLIRVKEIPGDRAKSLKDKKGVTFTDLSVEDIQKMPALQKAIDQPGFFTPVDHPEMAHVFDYLKELPYFFVSLNKIFFQVEAFKINGKEKDNEESGKK